MANENLSEKVSVNINSSTLSNIDLLVDNGYYSNRSDFINQSLRESLQKHQNILDRIIEKNVAVANEYSNPWFIGVYGLSNDEVQNYHKNGRVIKLTGYGVLCIDEDIDDDLLFSVVESIKVKGKIICKETVKKHYNLK